MASAARSVFSEILRSNDRCIASSRPLAGVVTLTAEAASAPCPAAAAASCAAFRLARRDLVGSTPPEVLLPTSAEGSSCSPPPEVFLPTNPMLPELLLLTALPVLASPTLFLRRIGPPPSMPTRSPELLRRGGDRRSPDEWRTTSG